MECVPVNRIDVKDDCCLSTDLGVEEFVRKWMDDSLLRILAIPGLKEMFPVILELLRELGLVLLHATLVKRDQRW